MKTYKNLIYKNITLEKCREIILKASKHKTHRKGVKRVLDNLDHYSKKLFQMVLKDKYEFKKCNYFIIQEYGKTRKICSAPFFPNQCIDYLFLECGFKDIILTKVNYESFGNCPNKGVHKGVKYIHKIVSKNKYRYFLKFDIKKYYEHINNKILYEQINKIIKDKKFLALAKQLLDNFGENLPIGSITSQYLALFYLTNFVSDLKVSCKRHKAKLIANYVDDFLILGDNKRELIKLLSEIEDKLKFLKLELNKKTIIYKTKERKISMLGYRFYSKIIMIRKSILKRFYRRKDKIFYKGWLKWTNCYKLKEKYLE